MTQYAIVDGYVFHLNVLRDIIDCSLICNLNPLVKNFIVANYSSLIQYILLAKLHNRSSV